MADLLLASTPFEQAAVFAFKGSPADVEQGALRDDDDIESWGNLIPAKDVSNQTFSPISLNGASKLSGRRDAETRGREAVGQEKECA